MTIESKLKEIFESIDNHESLKISFFKFSEMSREAYDEIVKLKAENKELKADFRKQDLEYDKEMMEEVKRCENLEAENTELKVAVKDTGARLLAEQKENKKLQLDLKIAMEALKKLRDCDWVISLPDRMDAVREVVQEALKEIELQEG